MVLVTWRLFSGDLLRSNMETRNQESSLEGCHKAKDLRLLIAIVFFGSLLFLSEGLSWKPEKLHFCEQENVAKLPKKQPKFTLRSTSTIKLPKQIPANHRHNKRPNISNEKLPPLFSPGEDRGPDLYGEGLGSEAWAAGSRFGDLLETPKDFLSDAFFLGDEKHIEHSLIEVFLTIGLHCSDYSFKCYGLGCGNIKVWARFWPTAHWSSPALCQQLHNLGRTAQVKNAPPHEVAADDGNPPM